MLAFEDIADRYIAFADEAKNVLNIQTETEYKQAKAFMRYLLEQAEDSQDEQLNGLIHLVTNAIRRYEGNEGEIQGIDLGDPEEWR